MESSKVEEDSCAVEYFSVCGLNEMDKKVLVRSCLNEPDYELLIDLDRFRNTLLRLFQERDQLFVLDLKRSTDPKFLVFANDTHHLKYIEKIKSKQKQISNTIVPKPTPITLQLCKQCYQYIFIKEESKEHIDSNRI